MVPECDSWGGGSALCRRVCIAQSGETSEVPVGGVEDAPVLDGRCRELSVGDEQPTGLALDGHPAEEMPVTIARRQQEDIGLFEPRSITHIASSGVSRSPGILGLVAMGRKAAGVFRVMWREGVAGVKEEIGVENNPSCVPPSSTSIGSTLS
jgi:hypothetical protein